MAKKKELAPLVRYDNKLNMIAFKGMSQVENDVFFALLYKLRDKGANEVRLDFSELKRLIGFEQNSEIIRKSVVGIAEKIARSIVKYETDESIKFFTLFQVLEVPKKDDYYIKAKISEPFAFMLNNLKDNYTAFEIAEFSNLTSKYAQTLYRLLKQFRSKGICTIFENDWERFKELMDIPPKMNMCDIDKDILKPAIKELMTERNLFDQTRAPFKGLFYEKHRGNSKGRPIIGISFYFLPQMQDTKFKDQAQKSLTIVANDIKRQDMLRQLKRSNPITGKEIDETQEYLGRYLRIHNDKLGLTDMLKIEKIEKSGEQLEVFLRNVDDDFRSSMRFDNFKHFKNTFERYGD